MKSFYSHGKLLLTGEYVVLDGALSLAIPSKFGQSLTAKPSTFNGLIWKSYDHHKVLWYEGKFEITQETIKSVQEDLVSTRLLEIFNAVQQLKPEFLELISGLVVQTQLQFPNNWGLGSSSTLINNIATWMDIDPFQLLKKTFGGSGYDLACANAKGPITYQLISGDNETQSETQRVINEVAFEPLFKDHLYFVHLNQKQDSREGIAHYKKHRHNVASVVNDISEITKEIISCNDLRQFEKLINAHEDLIA